MTEFQIDATATATVEPHYVGEQHKGYRAKLVATFVTDPGGDTKSVPDRFMTVLPVRETRGEVIEDAIRSAKGHGRGQDAIWVPTPIRDAWVRALEMAAEPG